MSHTTELNDRLRRIKIEPVLPPWQRTVHAVGGLTEVGYVPATDLLLTVTSTGRGLFDCISRQRVARDRTPPDEGGWYDETGLLAQGIGSAELHLIRLAGLHGGGLPRVARDGWSLELVAPDWPLQRIIVQPPGRGVLIEQFADGCAGIEEDYEIRAFGFSDSGRSFVVAVSHSLMIYSRP
jgi:hypothetical protein